MLYSSLILLRKTFNVINIILTNCGCETNNLNRNNINNNNKVNTLLAYGVEIWKLITVYCTRRSIFYAIYNIVTKNLLIKFRNRSYNCIFFHGNKPQHGEHCYRHVRYKLKHIQSNSSVETDVRLRPPNAAPPVISTAAALIQLQQQCKGRLNDSIYVMWGRAAGARHSAMTFTYKQLFPLFPSTHAPVVDYTLCTTRLKGIKYNCDACQIQPPARQTSSFHNRSTGLPLLMMPAFVKSDATPIIVLQPIAL